MSIDHNLFNSKNSFFLTLLGIKQFQTNIHISEIHLKQKPQFFCSSPFSDSLPIGQLLCSSESFPPWKTHSESWLLRSQWEMPFTRHSSPFTLFQWFSCESINYHLKKDMNRSMKYVHTEDWSHFLFHRGDKSFEKQGNLLIHKTAFWSFSGATVARKCSYPLVQMHWEDTENIPFHYSHVTFLEHGNFSTRFFPSCIFITRFLLFPKKKKPKFFEKQLDLRNKRANTI